LKIGSIEKDLSKLFSSKIALTLYANKEMIGPNDRNDKGKKLFLLRQQVQELLMCFDNTGNKD